MGIAEIIYPETDNPIWSSNPKDTRVKSEGVYDMGTNK